MNISRRDQKLVVAYSAGTKVDALIAKSMLDSAGIAYVVTGEAVQELEGVGSFGNFNPIFGPIRIQVLEEDLEHAKEVLLPLIERVEVVDEDTLAELAEKALNADAEEEY